MTSLNLPEAALAAALTILPLLLPEPEATPSGNYRLGQGGREISITMWMNAERTRAELSLRSYGGE